MGGIEPPYEATRPGSQILFILLNQPDQLRRLRALRLRHEFEQVGNGYAPAVDRNGLRPPRASLRRSACGRETAGFAKDISALRRV